MTMSDFREYQHNAADERQAWLGQTVIFAVKDTDTKIDHDQFVDRLDTAGLGAHRPNRPGDADVFRRVTTAAQRSRVPVVDEFGNPVPGRYANVMLREIKGQDDELIKRVVVEEVDPKGRKLSYTEAYEASYHKPSGSMRVDRIYALDKHVPKAAHDAADQIRSEFPAWKGCHDADMVRRVITRVLRDAAKGTALRDSGGVYFTLSRYDGVVEALERVVDTVPGVQFVTVPLLDSQKRRAMVRDAFQDQSVTEVDRIMVDIRRRLEAGETISDRQAAAFLRQQREIHDRLGEYEHVLQDSMDEARLRLQLLDRAVSQVINSAAAA